MEYYLGTGTIQEKETLYFVLGSFKKESESFITLPEAFSENVGTFCLDRCLSCHVVVDMFVSPGAFLFISILVDQGFYFKCLSEFESCVYESC